MKTPKKTHWKKAFIILALFAGISNETQAQNQIIPIWNKIPDAIKDVNYKENESIKDGKVHSTSLVSIPTLSIFLPKGNKLNQAAVLIFPGGGYQHLAFEKEGTKVAEWLNTLGIAAFVVKYRLPSDKIMKNKTVGPLQDAQEALRYVRQNA